MTEKSTRSELACAVCRKDPPLCLCAIVKKLPTRLEVLILQHPQEPDKLIGTARLAQTGLENATLRVGLSWANLSKALGRPAENARWAVLYMGSRDEKSKGPRPRLIVQRKGSKETEAVEEGDTLGLEGIVVLDGTWSQAKTLWWRNAWLLKLHRLTLNPKHRSLYGNLRKEPRKEAVSTIEAIAETLEALGESTEVSNQLRSYFSELLNRYRERGRQPLNAPERASSPDHGESQE